MCLGEAKYFSMYKVGSPKAISASVFVILIVSSRSDSEFTTLIPLPPPPEAAFMIMGYPIFFASSLGLVPIGPLDPGTTGSPIFCASFLADILFPMVLMISDEGPVNSNPLFSTCSAKSAFSARNP